MHLIYTDDNDGFLLEIYKNGNTVNLNSGGKEWPKIVQLFFDTTL